MAWVRSRRALRPSAISARIASTAPSRPFGAPAARPDCAARAALTASSGPGLALAAAVPAVGAARLDDLDAGACHVPGQASPVAAGPFDADEGDGPETAQPAQQAAVAGRGGRELPHAQQPPDGTQRRGDVHLRMGARPAGNSARVFYDGHCRPFLRLRDGTHPLAADQ
jgi:hypothetical protein